MHLNLLSQSLWLILLTNYLFCNAMHLFLLLVNLINQAFGNDWEKIFKIERSRPLIILKINIFFIEENS